jgi:hypothetical protein
MDEAPKRKGYEIPISPERLGTAPTCAHNVVRGEVCDTCQENWCDWSLEWRVCTCRP